MGQAVPTPDPARLPRGVALLDRDALRGLEASLFSDPRDYLSAAAFGMFFRPRAWGKLAFLALLLGVWFGVGLPLIVRKIVTDGPATDWALTVAAFGYCIGGLTAARVFLEALLLRTWVVVEPGRIIRRQRILFFAKQAVYPIPDIAEAFYGDIETDKSRIDGAQLRLRSGETAVLLRETDENFQARWLTAVLRDCLAMPVAGIDEIPSVLVRAANDGTTGETTEREDADAKAIDHRRRFMATLNERAQERKAAAAAKESQPGFERLDAMRPRRGNTASDRARAASGKEAAPSAGADGAGRERNLAGLFYSAPRGFTVRKEGTPEFRRLAAALGLETESASGTDRFAVTQTGFNSAKVLASLVLLAVAAAFFLDMYRRHIDMPQRIGAFETITLFVSLLVGISEIGQLLQALSGTVHLVFEPERILRRRRFLMFSRDSVIERDAFLSAERIRPEPGRRARGWKYVLTTRGGAVQPFAAMNAGASKWVQLLFSHWLGDETPGGDGDSRPPG